MRISDWSSDVCSSDLQSDDGDHEAEARDAERQVAFGVPVRRDVRRDAVVDEGDDAPGEIGRASCRERVCPYVSISVVAVSLKKKRQKQGERTETRKVTKERVGTT